MSQALRIDIISDVVCPWCAIGYGRLKHVLTKFDDQLVADIHWHPFELNPNMAMEGENLRSHLAGKYGTTLEGSIKARAMLTEEGNKVGFSFNYFDEMKMLNTHDCHQLILWASTTELQTTLVEALFEQFFTAQGEFDRTALISIAEKVGLDKTEAKRILEQQEFSEEVREIESKWYQQGIQGVPLFIFNGEHALSGAQDVATFECALQQYLN
ncbi:DsbA family oxidoreductase [Shewanella insulae]|uniref:DsbA family oxidoreductase n=1 Tax=Shewanella insulae TaxID=2681496 RepID=UPI001EFDC9AA|nr:DsbA family oxidoreductase [Shewanella insulae]MCG9713342.1 DsbA family oxidoreductase [Shewanella insulae]